VPAGVLMQVDDLARIPLSYPTYAGILVSDAAKAAHKLGLAIGWRWKES
jgi:hypothetical protein